MRPQVTPEAVSLQINRELQIERIEQTARGFLLSDIAGPCVSTSDEDPAPSERDSFSRLGIGSAANRRFIQTHSMDCSLRSSRGA